MMLTNAGGTNSRTDPTQVPRSPRGDGRTRTAAVGGGGGPRTGLGRRSGRVPSPRTVANHDHRRSAGTGPAGGPTGAGSHTGAASRRRTQAADPDRPGPAGRVGSADRASHSRGSPVALALDVQEHPSAGRRADAAAPPGRSEHGGSPASSGRLQPSGQPQDARGGLASGSQRPVRAHQRSGAALPESASAGRLGGHQEEGAGGGFQERGAGMAAQGPARGGAGS